MSQYRVCGIVNFGIDERGLLRCEGVLGRGNQCLAYPEGLALVRSGETLIVVTCCGAIASVKVSTGEVTLCVVKDNLVFWNSTLIGNWLLVSAHRPPEPEDYVVPTEHNTGLLLVCRINPETGLLVDSGSVAASNRLNRPSGLVGLGPDLLVTTFVSSTTDRGQPIWKRRVVKFDNCFDSMGNLVLDDCDCPPADYDVVSHTTKPWGLAVQRRRHKPHRLWVCGHGLALAAYEGDRLVVNAKAHPDLGPPAKKEHHVVHHPDRAHANVVVVV